MKYEDKCVCIDKDEVPFFDELDYTTNILVKGKGYSVYEADEIMQEELIAFMEQNNCTDSFSRLRRNELTDYEFKMYKIMDKINKEYKEIYNFILFEENGNLYISEHLSNPNNQDLRKCLDRMCTYFQKVIEDENLHFNPEFSNKWEVISNKLKIILDDCYNLKKDSIKI